MEHTLAASFTRRLSIRSGFWTDAALVITGSLVVSLLAQLRVYLPFTPVPITGQTLGVLLVAAALGSRRGALSLAIYVGGGLLGLPVFVGGTYGIAHLAGPTGGYLLGFVVAAYAIGSLAERGQDRRWPGVLIMFLAGEALIYLFGVLWLIPYTGAQHALMAGLLPFIPGEIVKIIAAGALLPGAWKLV